MQVEHFVGHTLIRNYLAQKAESHPFPWHASSDGEKLQDSNGKILLECPDKNAEVYLMFATTEFCNDQEEFKKAA